MLCSPLQLTRIEQAQQLQQRQRATVISTSASSSAAASSSSALPAASKSMSWSLSEVSSLAKAMARYPGGVSGRWEKIAAVVNAANEASGLQHQRTVKELLARAKQDEVRAVRRQTDRADDRAAHEGSTERPKAAAVLTATAAAEATAARPAAPAEPGTTESSDAGSVEASEEEWSAEEQSALESALRSISRDAADRWDLIAAAVATKSRKQCVARFRMIKASISASRT